MKRIAVVALAAFMMSATVPAFAAEKAAQMTKEEKDQCLLASKNCANEVDTLQKKIKKLNTEIKKGKKVYTAEELKKLEDKLNETEAMVDNLLNR